MSYSITPAVIAKFNRLKVNLSRKIVSDFLLFNSLSPNNSQRSKDKKSANDRISEHLFHPDINSNKWPMVVIQPMDNTNHASSESNQNVMATTLSKSQSGAKPKMSRKKQTTQVKTKRTNPKKTPNKPGQTKKKPVKPTRPQFVLPQLNKTKHNKK